MIEFSDLWFFLATFAALVGAGLGLPIPEELPVLAAGVWAAHPDVAAKFRGLHFLILPVCIAGVVISDVLLYGIGRRYGTRLLKLRWVARMIPPEKQQHIEENFHKHGVKVLLFARFLPGIRSPIFIMAGVMRLPVRRFVLADGIYAIPGVSLLFFLSWWFGQQFMDLILFVEESVAYYLKWILIVGLLLAVCGYFLYHFLKKPIALGDPEEMPIVGPVVARLEGPPAEPPPQMPTPTPLQRHGPEQDPVRQKP